jgi:DNA ligase-1
MNPSAFFLFAETAEQVGATTKRLEKAAVLGRYFGSLSDEDLRHAARYFAGYTFPLRDQRTTNVGGAALLAAIMVVSSADETTVRERLVALGDAGDVAREVFAASPQAALTPTLTLAQIAAFLETLAALSGTKRKIVLVAGLLREATPLEAKYVVKLLAGDLRIGLKEGAVEDAVARLAGVTVGQVQWVNMLEGDIGETALLARQGRLGEARMRLFHPLKFMLATPAADLADVARQMPVPFVVEDKFDGIRAQVHIAPHVEGDGVLHGVVCEGRRVAIFSRTLDEITQSFPDLIAPLAALLSDLIPLPLAGEGSVRSTGGGGLILDGEIIPVQGDLTLPFLELQKRLGRKTLTDVLRAEVPVAFVAYDVLYAEGRVLIEEPFSARRAILETLPITGGGVRRAASELFTDTSALDSAFDAARARGNEGLMVKDPTSPYKSGRRGRDWLKIKRALATLDVVVTAAQVGEGRRSRFLSDYTFAVRASETDPTLLNVGKAYSGLTDAETQGLSDWCRAHTLQEFAHGKVRTVEPQVVLEVTFDRVQASSRHKSGYALRFPRILRLRPDKPAGEIDMLETVRRLAEAEPTPPQAPTLPKVGGEEGEPKDTASPHPSAPGGPMRSNRVGSPGGPGGDA